MPMGDHGSACPGITFGFLANAFEIGKYFSYKRIEETSRLGIIETDLDLFWFLNAYIYIWSI